MNLSALNAAPDDVAREFFHGCCSAPAFVETMTECRPYAGTDAVLDASDAVFRAMSDADIDAAIAGHPRIGEKPTGTSAEDGHSRREQASIGDADTTVQNDIREANRAYEAHFDRVFLIRAAGRSPQEMLDEARRRLGNDPTTELAEVREQLRQITRLRLEQSFDLTAGASA